MSFVAEVPVDEGELLIGFHLKKVATGGIECWMGATPNKVVTLGHIAAVASYCEQIRDQIQTKGPVSTSTPIAEFDLPILRPRGEW